MILGKTVGNLTKNEFLVTDKPYSNFTLKAKVKLLSGNSGIQFRCVQAADGSVSGPQADMGKGCWGLLFEESGRGILDRYPEAKAAAMVREGDWNDYVITVKGNHVKVSLNGSVINDLDDPGITRSGTIALQLHTGDPMEVCFKDIEIGELSADDSGPSPTVEPAEPPSSVVDRPAPSAGIPAIPADTRSFDGKRFKVFEQELTWHLAKAKCEEMGGHLAIVKKAQENDFIKTILSEVGGLNSAWLGATDEKTEGRWIWGDGTVMGYTDWDSFGTQPNNKEAGEHYLVLYKGVNGWKWCDQPDQPIEHKPGFVCQWDSKNADRPTERSLASNEGRIKIEVNDPDALLWIDGQQVQLEKPGDKITLRTGEHKLTVKRGGFEIESRRFLVRHVSNPTLRIVLSARMDTPADAIEFDGKYYKIYKEDLTWHEAFDKCQALGGHLPIVRSEMQNKFLTSLLRDANVRWAWLGATDEKSEGDWFWIDGSVMTYTSWQPGQPNNGGQPNDGQQNKLEEEHYLIIGDRSQWLDLWIRGRGGWMPIIICQWDRPPSRPR
jgi:hypothetical protein